MLRIEFLRLCVLTGIAGVSGIARGADELPSDLHEALREIGVRNWSVVKSDDLLQIRCRVVDFEALARKAGTLGDGKVRVTRNSLSFERKGQRVELNLIA